MTPQFFTNSLQTTIDYYTRVLCFELVLEPGELSDHSCLLQLGDATIIFEEVCRPVDHSHWGRIHLFVDNLDEIFKNLGDFADVQTNPELTDAGTREFSIRDCNGMELVFAEVQPVPMASMPAHSPIAKTPTRKEPSGSGKSG